MFQRGIVLADPIGDMLTRIRNAQLRSLAQTTLPASKLLIELARLLKEEGYLHDYQLRQEQGPRRRLILQLKYKGKRANQPVISGLSRVSRPSRRVYVGWDKIPRVLNGLGIAVLSTSQGLLTDAQARQRRIGGELLCEVW